MEGRGAWGPYMKLWEGAQQEPDLTKEGERGMDSMQHQTLEFPRNPPSKPQHQRAEKEME